ncbi:MAG: hypothetical protein QOF89_6115 [Acidobacteriota bacterium]|jgi:hypothetical protein|nr:hypothetical protein [Acidobacteriota bacterium]
MKRNPVFLMMILALAMAAPAAAKRTDCQMRYTLAGWSAFYKVAHGQGTITCDNGQKARVRIEAKGGGLTAGKYKVTDGIGKFNEVSDISELFGTYVQAAAEAGAVKSSAASALTKGDVSLALAGHGTGINLGISFGKFTISKR